MKEQLIPFKTVFINNMETAEKDKEWNIYYKTYEEALEKGLYQALKLVKK